MTTPMLDALGFPPTWEELSEALGGIPTLTLGDVTGYSPLMAYLDTSGATAPLSGSATVNRT